MNGSDSPVSQDEESMLASPVIYNSMVQPLQGASDSADVDVNGSYTLDHFGVSRLELPSPSLPPNEQTCYVSKEAINENHKELALGKANFLNRDVPHSSRGLWPHLYQLACGSKHKVDHGDSLAQAKDKLVLSIRDNSGKDDNTWHLQHLKGKNIDETRQTCIYTMDEKAICSDKALLPQDARLKILSSSSFSHFFGKKTPKVNEIMHAHSGDRTQLQIGGTLQFDRTLSSTLAVNSSAQMQFSQCCRSGIDFDSNCAEINLREWLNRGNHMKNKVECLHIFFRIAELVSVAHSQGVFLQQLCPSYFILSAPDKLKYMGSSTKTDMDDSLSKTSDKKRPAEEGIKSICTSSIKHQKLTKDSRFWSHLYPAASVIAARTATLQDTNNREGCSSGSHYTEQRVLSMVHSQATGVDKSLVAAIELEEQWYACPEDAGSNVCKLSSNIYSLGVLLFELMCTFNSLEAHSAAMFDMHQRILPPSFLSEHPKEAGFCLWLLHPDSSSRPAIREILLSDLSCGYPETQSSSKSTVIDNGDEMGELDLLLDFLVTSEKEKQGHATKLTEDINCIEADIKGLEGKALCAASRGHVKRDCSVQDFMKLVARSGRNEASLITEMSQLENAYFSMRSQSMEPAAAGRTDKDLLKSREGSQVQKQNEMVSMDPKSIGGLDVFHEGLCKFACFSKFELRGTLRNNDLLNSANVICSLSFDRDEEYIAVAGASKTIKIFEYSALVNDAIDIHYPVIEMANKSKLSCVSWNSYIKNFMASTDYEGVVQVWDASTGLGISQHLEHQKRAWSVDFSKVDPTKFATGSDDCSVKLWCTNEKRSTCTIWSPANVCCVQFSPYSSHLLAFGSADHKVFGYDLRYTRIPWCSLAGHEKAVSYVKFLDSESLVSASTDNTLKLWNLSQTSLSGMSADACHRTFTGHTNRKHFVGLSAHDGYIACGSENNEVFTYYRSLPMPVTSYKFSHIGSTSQHDDVDDNGVFMSTVCWRSKSNMVLAANSGGNMRLLQLV